MKSSLPKCVCCCVATELYNVMHSTFRGMKMALVAVMLGELRTFKQLGRDQTCEPYF